MNTEELKKLAAAATPGPWSNEEIEPTDPEWGACEVFTSGSDDLIATYVTSVKNAAFISAANPAAILKLLAINAELVEALKTFVENQMAVGQRYTNEGQALLTVGQRYTNEGQALLDAIAKAEGVEL